MLPLVPLITLVAGLVPDIIGLFSGRRAGEAAAEVATVVQQVTGTRNVDEASKVVAEDSGKAGELRLRLEQIKQRYVELQLKDAQDERKALIEMMKAEISDRTRASNAMIEALKAEGWASKMVALGPPVISIIVLAGFFIFVLWMLNHPPSSTDPTALTLLNVVVGALVAGFTAVLNFWLGSSQGSRDKDKAVSALQVAQTEQATETARQVRRAQREAREQPPAAVREPPRTAEVIQLPPVPQPPVVPQPSHFDLCLPIVLGSEGGFADHPDDPGGATNLGITHATLADWRGGPVTVDDVRDLTQDEAEAIYRTKYWNAMCCEDMPNGLDLVLFDYGVNSGPRTAIRALQKIIGTAPDGVVGPFTLRAAKAADVRATIETLCRVRLESYQSLPHAASFGAGWTRRIDDVRRRALLMAGT